MKKALSLFALLSASLAWFGFQRQPAPPDLSTPQATVRSFVAALIARDADGVAACVQGAHSGNELKAALRESYYQLQRMTSAVVKESIVQVEGDKAKVVVKVTLQGSLFDLPNTKESDVKLSVVEAFQLERDHERWRIVPDATITPPQPTAETISVYILRPLAILAVVAARPSALQGLKRPLLAAQFTACLSNGHQVALGILQYAQDYDETLPPQRSDVFKVIYPYIKNTQVYRCPMDPEGSVSYVFNANLRGVSLAAIKFPERTVLLYEGSNMQFDFKHNRHTVVAFADGHSKLLTPEEAKRFFWYPAGKNPGVVKPSQAKPGNADKRKPAR